MGYRVNDQPMSIPTIWEKSINRHFPPNKMSNREMWLVLPTSSREPQEQQKYKHFMGGAEGDHKHFNVK